MKKYLFLLTAMFFLIGCNDDYDDVNNELDLNRELPDEIYASIQDESGDASSNSRTFVGEDGKTIVWHKGDTIGFFEGYYHNVKFAFQGEDGAVEGTFRRVSESPAPQYGTDKAYGIYPYHEGTTCVSDGKNKRRLGVHFPTKQTYAPNSFGRGANLMVAPGNNTNDRRLFFRNAGGFLIINLYGGGFQVKTIKLSTIDNQEKLAGAAWLRSNYGEAPQVEMDENATSEVILDCRNGGEGVTLSPDEENPTPFWFALPPVTIEKGIRIEVIGMNGELLVKEASVPVEITRNEIQPMAALKFEKSPLLWYYRSNTSDTTPISFDANKQIFDAPIKHHRYYSDLGKFCIEFEKPLTAIKEGAFVGTDITSIEIPTGVTDIAANAFKDTPLATITLPETLLGIGTNAFEGTRLQNIDFPDKLKSIGNEAFCRTPLTAITIPGSITEIGVDAFYKCENLKSVIIEESPNGSTLSIGQGIKTDGQDCGPFYYSPLEKIHVHRNMKLIDKNAEDFFPDLWDEGIFSTREESREQYKTEVLISSKVTEINPYMFVNVPVTEIVIPGSVNHIGLSAFYGCKDLKSIIFDESPNNKPLKIAQALNGKSDLGPFYYSPLQTIHIHRALEHVDEDGEHFIPNDYDEGLFSTEEERYRQYITDVFLTSNVKEILPYMFSYVPMTNITIPGSINSIGVDAFYYCRVLKTIKFDPSPTNTTLRIGPSTLKYKDRGAFHFTSLREVDLNRNIVNAYRNGEIDESPGTDEGIFGRGTMTMQFYCMVEKLNIREQVTHLPDYVFYDHVLKELTIPANVVSIGISSFGVSYYLEKIIFESTTAPVKIGYGFSNAEADYATYSPFWSAVFKYIYVDRPIIPDYELKDDIGIFYSESHEKYNQYKCDIVIGDNVKTIPPYTFTALNINSIKMSNSVSSIGEGAFSYCKELKSFTIPTSVTRIEPETFRNSKIESITIPGTMDWIGVDAFYKCDNLKNITFEESPNGSALKITRAIDPDGTSDLGPFYYSPLRKINLKRELKYLDIDGSNFVPDWWDEGVFANKYYADYDGGDPENNWTTELNIGPQVRSISEFMFSGVRVTMFWLPQEVKSIGYRAFHDCRLLRGVTLGHSTPPTLGKQVFDSCDVFEYIKILNGNLDEFKNAPNWSSYKKYMVK